MVVLATKVYVSGEKRRRAMDSLESLLANDLGELAVAFTVGLREDGFPSVTVTGADATAARSLLEEEWGAITPQREAGATHVGTLESWSDEGLVLDAGEDVHVPSAGLELGPGTPGQVRTRFGLVQHLPMRFVSDDAGTRLAEAERDRLYGWTRGPARVNVNSATRAQVRATVNRAGHADDVVTVERLGLLEQSIVCDPDTDAPGILAAIGPYLEAELLAVVP